MVKKPFAIFYIDANKAFFYGSNAASTMQIEFPEDTLSYLDVVNRDKFYQIIQTFVTTNKIEQVPVLILFSPYATFEKDVVGKLPEEINNDIQQFLDSVPYERVLSRIYKLQDKIKVTAVNKDLYEVIKHGFEKVHFPTVAVVSFPLLQRMIPDIGTTVNLELLASKFESVKQYSLITLEEINNPGKPNQRKTDSDKPNPLRLYALIGVFVVLVATLIGAIIMTSQPAPKPVTVQPTLHVRSIITPIVTPTPSHIQMEQNSVGSPSGKLLTPNTQAHSGVVEQNKL